METIWQDIRYAARTLLKERSFTVVALVILALGIGANSAIFSVVYGVLLKPLPYKDADRLVAGNIAYPEQQDLRDSVPAFDNLAVWATNQYTLTSDGDADQVLGAVVTPPFLSMLGEPFLGRTFQAADDSELVVVLSHDLWQKQFGGNPSVIGRAVNLSRRNYTIIGVMPAEFQFPSQDIKLWVPIAGAMTTVPEQAQNRSLRIFRALGHMKPGVSPAEVQAQVEGLSARLKRDFPSSNADINLRFTPIYDRLVGDVRLALFVLFATVGLILLIACANIAHLMLVTFSRAAPLTIMIAKVPSPS